MKKHQVTKEMIGKVINQRKFAWVDEQMRGLIPNSTYQRLKHGTPPERQIATAWVKEKGYHVTEEEGHVKLKRGDTVIAQCQVVLELETPEDLESLAEAVGIPSNWKNPSNDQIPGIIVP